MSKKCPICNGPVAKITEYKCLATDKHRGWKPLLRFSVAKVPSEPNPVVHIENLLADGRPIADTYLGPEDRMLLEHHTVGAFYLTRFKPVMSADLRKLVKRHRPSALRIALEQLITKESA